MQKSILVAILVIGLFPISSSFSQGNVDTDPTLGIGLTSFTPYHYKAEDGRTVIIGEVENTKDFPVSGVKIRGVFFDDVNPSPLESTVGTTLLEVIPPKSKVPYVIYSPSTNSAITNVSVNLLGFNSAGAKLQELNLEGSLQITMGISYTGTVTNNAGSAAEDTRIHLIMHDAFDPPRLLSVSTVEIDESIAPGASTEFSFEEEQNPQAAGFFVMAESGNSLSNTVDVQITPPELIAKKITINDISINDSEGNKLTDAQTNSPIFIQSNLWIQIASQGEEYDQDYVYYAQVKQSGAKAFVEYIGTFEGHFDGPASQNPIVEWTPQNSGLYFIETFVWDPKGVPLASKGPVILVLVN